MLMMNKTPLYIYVIMTYKRLTAANILVFMLTMSLVKTIPCEICGGLRSLSALGLFLSALSKMS